LELDFEKDYKKKNPYVYNHDPINDAKNIAHGIVFFEHQIRKFNAPKESDSSSQTEEEEKEIEEKIELRKNPKKRKFENYDVDSEDEYKVDFPSDDEVDFSEKKKKTKTTKNYEKILYPKNSKEIVLFNQDHINNNNAIVTQNFTHKPIEFFEMSKYFVFPQGEAAKKLGVPSSTLSKRWTEAANGRKWPFRSLQKLDRLIVVVLKNYSLKSDNLGEEIDISRLPNEDKVYLQQLFTTRKDLIRPVTIRL
jgi:hypothetical protein